MVDLSVGTSPPIKRRSGPVGDGGSVRRVKRAKCQGENHQGRIQVVAAIRRVSTRETSAWMKRIPSLFSVAVSVPHMLAQVYLLCRIQVEHRSVWTPDTAGHDVIRRLALWLKPLFPEIQQDVIFGFLLRTKLSAIVVAYIEALLSASCQQPPILFSNDFGMEKAFDANMHSESVEEGKGVLRPGDQCVVIFPALLVKDSRTEELRILSKRYVLGVSPPGGLEELLCLAGTREEGRQLLSGGASMNKGAPTEMHYEASLSGNEE